MPLSPTHWTYIFGLKCFCPPYIPQICATRVMHHFKNVQQQKQDNTWIAKSSTDWNITINNNMGPTNVQHSTFFKKQSQISLLSKVFWVEWTSNGQNKWDEWLVSLYIWACKVSTLAKRPFLALVLADRLRRTECLLWEQASASLEFEV